jgi:hypothetical protein
VLDEAMTTVKLLGRYSCLYLWSTNHGCFWIISTRAPRRRGKDTSVCQPV